MQRPGRGQTPPALAWAFRPLEPAIPPQTSPKRKRGDARHTSRQVFLADASGSLRAPADLEHLTLTSALPGSNAAGRPAFREADRGEVRGRGIVPSTGASRRWLGRVAALRLPCSRFGLVLSGRAIAFLSSWGAAGDLPAGLDTHTRPALNDRRPMRGDAARFNDDPRLLHRPAGSSRISGFSRNCTTALSIFAQYTPSTTR